MGSGDPPGLQNRRLSGSSWQGCVRLAHASANLNDLARLLCRLLLRGFLLGSECRQAVSWFPSHRSRVNVFAIPPRNLSLIPSTRGHQIPYATLSVRANFPPGISGAENQKFHTACLDESYRSRAKINRFVFSVNSPL